MAGKDGLSALRGLPGGHPGKKEEPVGRTRRPRGFLIRRGRRCRHGRNIAAAGGTVARPCGASMGAGGEGSEGGERGRRGPRRPREGLIRRCRHCRHGRNTAAAGGTVARSCGASMGVRGEGSEGGERGRRGPRRPREGLIRRCRHGHGRWGTGWWRRLRSADEIAGTVDFGDMSRLSRDISPDYSKRKGSFGTVPFDQEEREPVILYRTAQTGSPEGMPVRLGCRRTSAY